MLAGDPFRIDERERTGRDGDALVHEDDALHGARGVDLQHDRRRRLRAGASAEQSERSRERAGEQRTETHRAHYSVAQTSSFVRVLAITASVNSAVEEWPPRSLVASPPRTVSKTLS